ncbi:MAG: GNAT family N-acetyltransferase [Candidatus Helarchaeota archaeon]|nr:GNAT family N-acetyltransferase [Candidatus Helarchaeota archaeon]
MPDIEIRPYTSLDFESALRVYEHLCSFYRLPFNLEKSRKFFSSMIYFQQYHTLVAIDKKLKTVVGLLFSEFETDATQETCGCIKHIYVEEKYRKSGIMTALINKAISYFKELKVDQVAIHLRNENLPYLTYYLQKFGLSPTATIVAKSLK